MLNSSLCFGLLLLGQGVPQEPAPVNPGLQTAPALPGTPQQASPAASALTAEPPSQGLQVPVTGVLGVERRPLPDLELKDLKAKERGPLRFGADLFEMRERFPMGTEGGITDDYVLGTGDFLRVSVFGSATFEVPAQVDGRGELIIPKVGTVKVAGLTLERARGAVQAKVARIFSQATVDLSVTRLREVRVFILGEVHRPGSYLVPSLSSVVNVLGLGGGPTRAGSLREIRVIRGGAVIHRIDLYPLRSEGIGNLNVNFHNGDTVFVPLALNQILLEGAFTRVVAATQAGSLAGGELEREPEAERARVRAIKELEAELAADGPIQPVVRLSLEERLEALREELRAIRSGARTDRRVGEGGGPVQVETPGMPDWWVRWRESGKAPVMQFEMKPGETVADALRFAGGISQEGFVERLGLRRMDAQGNFQGIDVPIAEVGRVALQRGDLLSALPRRDGQSRAVTVAGWARVPGSFARTEGLTVGALLRRESQVMPDAYLARGEVVRTLPDGRTRLLVFDVARALAGAPEHDLLLEDRDRIELFRLDDVRLRQTVSVQGPVVRAGNYAFREGMRASDLLFMAGIPLRQADRWVAELSRARDGRSSEVRRLELSRLLSSETASPVDLKDDAANPLLEPFDQISIFAKPDYRTHRTVTLSGQVRRPGAYSLDQDRAGLRELLERAGGLTPEAMPQGAIFLRRMGSVDPEKVRAAEAAGIEATDPTSSGINDILKRLSETRRQPTTGQLLQTPVLHGLSMGNVNRMVIRLPEILAGDAVADVELQDGDELIVPRRTDAAYVVGEAASPFAAYKVKPGTRVRELLRMAGGPTRNADTWNIRLLKADGRILDSWVSGRKVEPGDAVLVPQRIRRDSSWQENLNALTPLALILNALK